MSNKLTLETTIEMVSQFDDSNADELYRFLNYCKFVRNNIDRYKYSTAWNYNKIIMKCL